MSDQPNRNPEDLLDEDELDPGEEAAVEGAIAADEAEHPPSESTPVVKCEACGAEFSGKLAEKRIEAHFEAFHPDPKKHVAEEAVSANATRSSVKTVAPPGFKKPKR